jgi:pimeloyl-ACP methyl ester carboxylesterase
MDVPTTRAFTPARVLALALIAALVAGLAYLRVASDAEVVAVPADATAGDLDLEPCTYPTEAGDYDADCGTLIVSENPADTRSQLLALPVVRVRARSDHPTEPIFFLEGGPGFTNLDFPMASRFADDHDVVLVGYRGVDGSVRLDCPEVEQALSRSADYLAQETFRAYGAAYRACANRLTDEGVDLTRYGLTQQIADMEAARVAFGYDRIDLLSQSAGTRTAMIYAWRYPERIHRAVMAGVNPPGHLIFDPQTTDEQLDRYAKLCAADADCRARTDDLAASLRRTSADMPERWLFLPISGGSVRLLSFTGLMGATAEAFPPGPAATLDGWLSAAEGDTSGLWITSFLGDVLYPKLFVWGQYAAAARVDAQAARDYFSSAGWQDSASLARAGNAVVWGGGRLVDAWPAAPDEDEYSRVRTSQVETLLIGGELDVSTPPQVATAELLPHLPNGQEIVLTGIGHNPSFWADQPEAGTRLITTFLDSGRIDDSLYEPQRIDFTPSSTLTGTAKTVAGLMVGLALITVASLLWMARRVSTKGPFGPTASAALRSVYPLVLGLGGWFLGVLAVLTARLTVPIDDARLVVVAVGAPIGLGISVAWVHRDRPAATRAAGLAAAAAGALAGAWLGFNAIDGLSSLITAIVGAAVGANLFLIVLDMTRVRQERLRLAPSAQVEATRTRVGT